MSYIKHLKDHVLPKQNHDEEFTLNEVYNSSDDPEKGNLPSSKFNMAASTPTIPPRFKSHLHLIPTERSSRLTHNLLIKRTLPSSLHDNSSIVSNPLSLRGLSPYSHVHSANLPLFNYDHLTIKQLIFHLKVVYLDYIQLHSDEIDVKSLRFLENSIQELIGKAEKGEGEMLESEVIMMRSYLVELKGKNMIKKRIFKMKYDGGTSS